MENSVLYRFRALVGSDKSRVADLKTWDHDELEKSLARLEKGRAALVASLEKIEAAQGRFQAKGDVRAKPGDLEAHANRLRRDVASLEPQIALLQRAQQEPGAIAGSSEARSRLRNVLAGTSMEMARVGHSIYLVDEWFFELQPHEKANRRQEIQAVLGNVQAGAMRSRN